MSANACSGMLRAGTFGLMLMVWGNHACSQGSAPAVSNDVTPVTPSSTPTPPSPPAAIPTPNVTLGERELLLGSGALGLFYFPDEGVSSLDGPVDGSAGSVRLILTASTSTYLVEGEDLRSLDSAVEVLALSGPPMRWRGTSPMQPLPSVT